MRRYTVGRWRRNIHRKGKPHQQWKPWRSFIGKSARRWTIRAARGSLIMNRPTPRLIGRSLCRKRRTTMVLNYTVLLQLDSASGAGVVLIHTWQQRYLPHHAGVWNAGGAEPQQRGLTRIEARGARVRKWVGSGSGSPGGIHSDVGGVLQ